MRNSLPPALVLAVALAVRMEAQQPITVQFDLCAQSATWQRPSAAVQSKIWSDPRYRDVGPSAYEWTHNFIANEPDSASITYANQNLSGVWTDVQTNQCPRRDGERGRWTEIWVLNHHVIGISLTGSLYTLEVAPRERGYEIVQFRRPDTLGSSMATLRFVSPERKVLAEWMESEPSVFAPR